MKSCSRAKLKGNVKWEAMRPRIYHRSLMRPKPANHFTFSMSMFFIVISHS